jgi:hypothetical protein
MGGDAKPLQLEHTALVGKIVGGELANNPLTKDHRIVGIAPSPSLEGTIRLLVP